MACVPVPSAPIPELPAPLSIAPPPLPSLPNIPNICCKLPPLPVQVPPVDLPVGTLNPAIVAIINANLKLVRDYLDALEIPCPRG